MLLRIYLKQCKKHKILVGKICTFLYEKETVLDDAE